LNRAEAEAIIRQQIRDTIQKLREQGLPKDESAQNENFETMVFRKGLQAKRRRR
jgi:hypothetical protein